MGLNTAFVVLEAIFGFASNSMALIADAGHNLSDVLGLIVAWLRCCCRSARRQPA
jgi:cobalt-zinc-cadmium efflux system protein